VSRPRKSTFDAWLDTFAGWSEEDQAGALKACQMVMRIAPAIRKSSAESKTAPKAPPPSSEGSVVEGRKAPGAVQRDLI
jgi:hypothetical protein